MQQNQPRINPQGIKKVGLKKHLDDTREYHNGYAYDDFVKMRDPHNTVNKVNMARIFKVDRRTIEKWINIYEEEIGNENS